MASHPVIDSPRTPGTPATPADITINREVEVSAPVSFSDCQELARQVSSCSKSLIEGHWVGKGGGNPRFIPSNFESAKAFLRASVDGVTVRKPRRSPSDTPVTSRRVQHSGSPGHSPPDLFRHNQQEDMAMCHGCHGAIGQSQHQGSAPGKNVCTLRHSDFCRGGIVEDPSYRACPMGYVQNPNIQLASESGFESTMVTSDFRPLSNQLGPAYSTPAIQPHVIPPSPHIVTSNPHPVIATPLLSQSSHQQAQASEQHVGNQGSRATGERFPGMVYGNGHEQGGETVGMPDEVRNRIEAHRAANQVENETVDRPNGGININDLRSDTILRSEVEEFIAEAVRKRIPALSAARSADQNQVHYGAPYSYNAAQLLQVSGDGIRVTADGVTSPQNRLSGGRVDQDLQNVQYHRNNQPDLHYRLDYLGLDR